jgi:uncharacterized repeat protein (TIGR01451 family)
MTSPRLGRLIICALIAGALLFLMPDQLRDPFLNKNANYSLTSITRDNQNIDRATRTRIEQTYGKLPMRFEANEGQTDALVKFKSRGAGYAVFLTADETVLQLHKREPGKTAEQQMADQPAESVVLRMKLVGSNRPGQISGIGKLQTTSHYFIGDDPAAWRRGISSYSKVKYEAVYPGIDLVWYGNQQLLEHDFLIAPGADPSRIKISFSGTNAMSIDDEGALVMRAGGEGLRMLKPLAWQESNGNRQMVRCDYRLNKKEQVELLLGEYDAKLPLVIDPVLVYSTYIGGIGIDSGLDIAVDAEGAAYITGQTTSGDFPGPSPIQPARGANTDAYVLKINPAGNAIVFGTWIGGNGSDSASAVSVDPGGNVYLAGTTNSLDFPLQNPLQASRLGSQDAFAVKIDSSGSALLYSTYVGGTGTDSAAALAVDGNGNLYLTGTTDSSDFPVVNAFQPTKNGSGAYASENGGDSWGEINNGLDGANSNDVVIFPGNSSTIFAGTDRGVFKSLDRGSSWNLLGGTQSIRNINQVIVDPTTPDILYAVSLNQLFKSIDGGATWVQIPISPVSMLAIAPSTPSTLYAGTFNGLSISANGGDSWTTVFIPSIFGGTIGQIDALAVDPITPSTVYVGSNQGIYKSIDGGATWTFAGNGLPFFFSSRVTRIAISRSDTSILYALLDNTMICKTTNSGGNWVQLNTPLIGIPPFSQLSSPLVVAPDNSEVVYFGTQSSGMFRSNNGGATWNTINNGLNSRAIRAIVIDLDSPTRIYAGGDSGNDAFIAKLDATASSFVFSSYIGGSATDSGIGIVVDSTGAAYIAGSTTSTNFPFVDASQATFAGQTDAFVAKVDADGSAVSWATYLGGNNLDNAIGIAVSTTGEIYVAGITTSSDFPVNNAIQPSLKGTQDGFITSLKNDGSGLNFSTYLGGAGSDGANAIAVDSAGNLYVTGTTDSLDFPVISAVQSTRGGNPSSIISDAFVTKLSRDGASIVYSTYLGGSGLDIGNGIAVDASANAYVTGNTFSFDFPTTPFPIRSASPFDAFVAKLALSADLAITLTGTPNPVMINDQLTYSLIVTNNGPDPATSSRVTDTLPAGVSLVSSETSQGSCSGTTEISCELGDLAAGSSATITIIVTPSSLAPISNSARVTSGTPDIDPANDTATLETNISPSPSIYGRVTTAGGNGLGGVTVGVNGAVRPPVVTTGNGDYQFAELAQGGSYTVTLSRQGYVFNPPTRSLNNLQSDQRADFGAVACIFSISSDSQSFPAMGGTSSVAITGPDPQCAWTAITNVPWITFTSAPNGNGSGILSFRVEPTIGSRNGTIIIGGNRFTVFQEFNACDTVSFNTTPQIDLPRIDYGIPFLVKDFNQDSRLDLVINRLGFDNRGLSFFPGTSDGKFGSPINLLSLTGFRTSVRNLATGDFNNDGTLDIVAIISENDSNMWSIRVFLNNGTGGFAQAQRYNLNITPMDVATGDFNGDGTLDLVVVISDFSLPFNAMLLFNDGTGSFGQPQKFPGGNIIPRQYPDRVEPVDLDGDGKLDLVFFGGAPVRTFKGDGAGGFTFFFDINTSILSESLISDFNGDGRPDLFSLDDDGPEKLSVYLNDGTGRFGPPVTTHSGVRFPLFTQKVIADDFNGDGKTDIVTNVSNSGRNEGMRLFTATAVGKFSEPTIYLPSILTSAMASGDFNLDGLPDIFSMNATGGFVIVTAQVGGFNAPRGFDITPPGPFSPQISPADIKSGDLNGDGVFDLVVVGSGLTDPIVMFGNGRGEFVGPVTINSGIPGEQRAIELRDFNNDSKLDLAVLNPNSLEVAILLGNGQGQFTRSATFTVGNFASGLASADFNNDGKLDLVARDPSRGLALFLGDGQGGFTQSTSGIGGNLTYVTFTTADFNGDGNADLAFSDETQLQTSDGYRMVILPGDGQGGFGEPINVKTDDSIVYPRAADLNLDGRDDLIYTRQYIGNAVYVALSNPGGGFATPVSYQVDSTTRSVVSTDINGDGKPDLISASFDTGTVSILLGNGAGGFNQPVTVPAFASSYLISAGDFDGDGRNDLAIARGGPVIGVLKNSSTCASEGSVRR